MEIHRCFEILELPQNASIQDVRQTYKDLVNIWHPDRVGDNSRLKKKAEEKLKDINIAYEELVSFLSSQKKASPPMQKKPREQPKPEVFHSAESARQQTTKDPKAHVEIRPKSNFFSGLWTFLSEALDALNAAKGSSNEPVETWRRTFEPTGVVRRQGMGRGMGRGKGMGGRGRGRGRRR